MGPKSTDNRCPLRDGKRENPEEHREEGHEKLKAGIGVILSQAKEY